jgi:hypothetical protein
VRRGLSSLATAASTTNYLTVSLSLDVNGTSVAAPPIRLLGPGDITSMDAGAVIRTDPRNGADAFEPNYLATVELALPDLPWLFTPAAPDDTRLRPWICLIVIAENDGIRLDVPRSGPAVLNLNKSVAELPDLANIDAWAHAQVLGDSLSGDALNAALDSNTGVSLARLVSPRKLEPNARYLACIVPTYRAGANAGLGQPVSEHDLAPAWDAHTTAPFQLPVYYYFRFQTGPGGDFASLASRIMPPATPLDAGKRPVDVSRPGFGAAPAPGVTLQFEGALRAQGEPPTAWPPGAQVPYETALRKALAPAAAPDPVVAPPIYGRTQSGKDLPKDHNPPVWLGDLNLDPRMRAAAGAGAQIVQRDQEALVASAWDQLGEIRKANQLLRQAQLARSASASLWRRHLGAIAGDGAYLQVTGPVHSRVSLTLGAVTFTLRGHVAASRLPVRALSATMRKLSRPRGALGRQLGTGKPSQLVDRLNLPASAGASALTAAGPVQPPRGMVALDDISPGIQVSRMASSIPATTPGWIVIAGSSTTASSHTGTEVRTRTDSGTSARTGTDTGIGGSTAARLIDWNTDPDVPVLLKGAHANLPAPFLFPTDAAALNNVAAGFRAVAGPANQYLNTAPAAPPDLPSLGNSSTLTAARTQLQARLDPARTIVARFGALIPLGTGPDPLQPLRIAPQFPQPMYSALADLSPAWMLPGADKVPMNAAVLLQTNPRFVEAFMVGLNEAMAGELLWREFPVGLTATYFQNFWRVPVPNIPPIDSPDIPSIDSFDASSKLGDHTADHATGGNLVLLIRADLFRRYPNTVVSAVQAQWSADGKTRQLSDTRKWPLFRGLIGTDLNFFGFDVVDARGVDSAADGTNAGWYFVLEEHVTEPRFGLEPESSAPTGSSWNDLSWSYAKLDPNSPNLDPLSAPAPRDGAGTWGQGEPAAWGQGAAAMAYILMRRPVRVAMHGRALLAAAGT